MYVNFNENGYTNVCKIWRGGGNLKKTLITVLLHIGLLYSQGNQLNLDVNNSNDVLIDFDSSDGVL